jgi:hypothetical protein
MMGKKDSSGQPCDREKSTLHVADHGNAVEIVKFISGEASAPSPKSLGLRWAIDGKIRSPKTP